MFKEKQVYFVKVLINGRTERARMALDMNLSENQIRELILSYFNNKYKDTKFLEVEIYDFDKESYTVVTCD